MTAAGRHPGLTWSERTMAAKRKLIAGDDDSHVSIMEELVAD